MQHLRLHVIKLCDGQRERESEGGGGGEGESEREKERERESAHPQICICAGCVCVTGVCVQVCVYRICCGILQQISLYQKHFFLDATTSLYIESMRGGRMWKGRMRLFKDVEGGGRGYSSRGGNGH